MLQQYSRVAALSFLLVACGGENDGEAQPAHVFTLPAQPTFTYLNTEVLATSCAFSSCHGGSKPGGGLDLRAAVAYDNLVDVQSRELGITYVAPGAPDDSLLVQLLEGPVGDVRRMPRRREPIPVAVIAAIREWIALGAAND